jgi:pseudouridine synthase
MTNDGEFANRLTHPRYEVYKEYELMVKGSLGPEDVDRLEEGIFSPAEKTPGSRPQESHLKILRRDGERTVLTMELREGSNRQIRQLMADLGHPVKRMRRTRMGPVRLRGLAVGAWRDLTHSELSQLRQEAFADVATIQKRRASPSKNVTKSVGKNLRTTSRRSSTPQRTPAKNSNGRSIRGNSSGRRSAS